MRTAFAGDLPRRAALAEMDAAPTVAIAASSTSVRAAIEALARDAGMRVLSEREPYDVLLMALDLSTSLPTSTQTLSLLTPSAAAVCVIWTGSPPPLGTVARLLRAGVAGVMPSEIAPSALGSGLRAIRSGLQVIDPIFTREEPGFSSVARATPEELTQREQEVLTMLAEGLSNKEISYRLSISTHTVKFHISSILGKLGATSRTEAVSIGIRSGRVAI